jgi:pyruvate carboxylase
MACIVCAFGNIDDFFNISAKTGVDIFRVPEDENYNVVENMERYQHATRRVPASRSHT